LCVSERERERVSEFVFCVCVCEIDDKLPYALYTLIELVAP